MTGTIFIDTNIFLYAKFNDQSQKFMTANALFRQFMRGKSGFISTQVVNEFCVNAIKKGGEPQEIHETALQFALRFHIVPVTMQTIIESFRIYKQYQFSHWDSLIVASALEYHCEILFTEDLSDGQIIDKTVKIINPFMHYQDILTT